jgi:MFS family permease
MAALSSLLWFAVLFLVKCTKHSHPENELPAEIKEYYKALPSAVMLGFIFSSFFNFISDYLKGMNILPVSIFFQAYTASLILIRIFIIKKMDRWNKKAVITTGFFIGFAGLLTAFGIFYMQNIYMAAIAGMFYGIAHSLLYPTVNSSFIELTPHRKGKANIMFVISFYGGVFLASFIDGIIADFTGYSNMYAIISGVILTFALYLYLKRSQKNRAI